MFLFHETGVLTPIVICKLVSRISAYPTVGGSENSDGIPEHGSARIQNMQTFKSITQFTKEETKNLLKTAPTSKVVNPFTRALAPPFIRRRRDFYILKIPSNLRNIPSVNMYMNAFYIS
jgi:hypothetical protein